METAILEEVTTALQTDNHVRHFSFAVRRDGQEIIVTGEVASYYQKQLVGVSAMRILQKHTNFRLRNEVEVRRSSP